MGLFDRKKGPGPVPPPIINSGSNYSEENIEMLLDQIGLLRLSVHSARMKLLVSRVAWETPKYIAQKSSTNGGQLPGGEVSSLQEQLQMVKSVLDRYIDIEGNPGKYGDKAKEAKDQGLTSLQSYVNRIEAACQAGSVDLIGFNVDTKILSTHQF